MFSSLRSGSLLLSTWMFLLAVFCPAAHGEPALRPNFLFADNMVLQRDRPVPVWGTAGPDETVTVEFAGKSVSGKSDAAGRWKVLLEALPAGGPHDLTISSGTEKVVAHNVLVGDVWLCSGQSNMWWSLFKSKGGAQEIPNANHPNIRLITLPPIGARNPLENLDGPAWSECTAESVKDFSAVAYYFGKNLFEHTKVPVGLINASWGGTMVQAWTSLPSLETDPDQAALIGLYYSTVRLFDEEFSKGIVDKDGVYIDHGLTNEEAGWAAAELDENGWQEMELPKFFNYYGKPLYLQGAVWFRKTVDIPESWSDKELILALGLIRDYDIAFVNGREVGRNAKAEVENFQGPLRREYAIPPGVVKPGRNVIAVRVFNAVGAGGMIGFKDDWRKREMAIYPKDDKESPIKLEGNWKYKVSIKLPYKTINGFTKTHHLPSCLYNGLIAPIAPFALRGFVWYQGENNIKNAWQYRSQFPIMIRSWREAWQEDIPFLYVQLPNLGDKPSENPVDPTGQNDWSELRDAQWRGLREPRTAMVATIDLGDASIHPGNKQGVGQRLALAARGLALGEKIEYSGPLYAGMSVEGDKIRVRFTHVGGGLVAKDSENGELRQFAIAGKDQKYIWAQGKIDGDTVVVWSDKVPEPVAVSYAWSISPAGCNLYNADGLPAAPFRSDDWPLRSYGRKAPF